MIYVLSGGVTNVAGVIRISYPANSTLVVKGTSSGKQFTKDTNTTSSAKAYIFLAPIGNASYTLTATNSAGKTVSKQVYVAKDQVQSVVLAYELVLLDSENGGLLSGYSLSGKNIDPAIDLTGYTTLAIKGTPTYLYAAGYYTVWGLRKTATGDFAAQISLDYSENFTIDISSLEGTYFFGAQDNIKFTDNNTTISNIASAATGKIQYIKFS